MKDKIINVKCPIKVWEKIERSYISEKYGDSIGKKLTKGKHIIDLIVKGIKADDKEITA
tara:strand:- start:67 stop:243 length:177 start_codon:yes stop_codon:yes gene_type:complete